MSPRVVDLSPDLQKLRDDCYGLRVTTGGFLVVSGIPYVTREKTVAYGELVAALELSAGRTVNPVSDHTVYFAGDEPCDQNGEALRSVINDSSQVNLEPDLAVSHRFSSKPADGQPYPDYHAKMTSYVQILLTQALALDSTVTAVRAHPVVLEDDDPESPFVYHDTASARAEISAIAATLAPQRIGIVGLGGTGSYILDLVAKTPVKEIHLFDGDDFLDHNAFRAPGAAGVDELNAQPKKVQYLADRYAKMKNGISAHPYPVDDATVGELRDLDFVFLAADGGRVKRLVVRQLDEWGVSYIDVGLSVDKTDEQLGGMVCLTTSTPTQRAHALSRVDLSDPAPDDIYEANIQIAELNALNAVLAVIKWKKLAGFYRDLGREHFTAYTLDTNLIANADRT